MMEIANENAKLKEALEKSRSESKSGDKQEVITINLNDEPVRDNELELRARLSKSIEDQVVVLRSLVEIKDNKIKELDTVMKETEASVAQLQIKVAAASEREKTLAERNIQLTNSIRKSGANLLTAKLVEAELKKTINKLRAELEQRDESVNKELAAARKTIKKLELELAAQRKSVAKFVTLANLVGGGQQSKLPAK